MLSAVVLGFLTKKYPTLQHSLKAAFETVTDLWVALVITSSVQQTKYGMSVFDHFLAIRIQCIYWLAPFALTYSQRSRKAKLDWSDRFYLALVSIYCALVLVTVVLIIVEMVPQRDCLMEGSAHVDERLKLGIFFIVIPSGRFEAMSLALGLLAESAAASCMGYIDYPATFIVFWFFYSENVAGVEISLARNAKNLDEQNSFQYGQGSSMPL
jgi:hypothetical protein